jgi:hypothetical protein
MKTTHQLPLAALLAALCVGAPVTAEELTADQLIAKVVDARKTSGFRVRAKLIVTTAGSNKRDSKQILVKGRREGEATKVLYVALWPDKVKGHALVIEKSADHKTTGFLMEPPDKVTPLTPEMMKEAFLGSDLTIEDLSEDFWRWPSQKIVGEEIVDRKPCKIVESRPAPELVTSYSLVKTWISPETALPMRIHKFGKDGQPVKRLNVEKAIKQEGNRWTPATITVEPEAGGRRTMFDGSNSQRDIDVPAEDFTPEKIRALLKDQ